MSPSSVAGPKKAISVVDPDSLVLSSPANEEQFGDLTRLLGSIRAEALFAVRWWRERDKDRSRPLEPIVSILSANNLVVSEALGEAGFKSDPTNFEVAFNAKVLRSIIDVVGQLFPEVVGSKDFEELKRQAIALYVFHELTHITQRFGEHQLAQNLKTAFTPDELSKLDLVADVRAAHCNALISTAIEADIGWTSYLEAYRNNLLLSYQLLVRAFSIKDADHKKKRALGLLTNVVLCQSALNPREGRGDQCLALAVRPAFTSVDQEEGCIVALTCGQDGWEILFHGVVATNRMSIAEMWDAAGTTEPDDILALLRVAYQQLLSD